MHKGNPTEVDLVIDFRLIEGTPMTASSNDKVLAS
jgi:hypothetical protein